MILYYYKLKALLLMAKFQINSINIVSTWGFNLPSNSDCTICRCSLNTQSIYHQDKGIDSYVVQGVCGHSFHNECIKPWAEKNKHCPICSATWSYRFKPDELNQIPSTKKK